jgi:hypothetical protein
VLYIEYPIRNGWEPSADSPKPESMTQKFYRFRVPLEKFQEKTFTLSFHQQMMDSYRLDSLSREQIEFFVKNQYIDSQTLAKLQKIIDIRSQIAEVDAKINALAAENAEIAADQQRLRDNIESLSKTAEAKVLITRYIGKANDQETRIESIEKEKKGLTSQKEQLIRDQAAEIRNFEMK